MRRGFVRRGVPSDTTAPSPSGSPSCPGAHVVSHTPPPAAPPRIQSPEYAPLMQSVDHLLKRDATTKLRALSSLSAFCGRLEESGVGDAEEEALSYIAHVYVHQGVYRLLSLDENSRVRSGCHGLLFGLASLLVAAKRFSGYLKQCFFCLWCGQYDEDERDVARMCCAGFERLFTTPQRRAEAVILCHGEFIDQFRHERQSATAAAASGTSDDRVARDVLARSTASAVVGLTHAIEAIASYSQRADESRMAHCDRALAAMDAECARFVAPQSQQQSKKTGEKRRGGEGSAPSLAHCLKDDTNDNVRRAAYTFVTTTIGSKSVIEKLPSLRGHYGRDATCAGLLESLREPSSICVPSMFSMVLQVTRYNAKAWNDERVQSRVLPKLWSLFRNAFHGEAAACGPFVLVLIALVPDELPTFRALFLESLWHGFMRTKSLAAASGATGTSSRQNTDPASCMADAIVESVGVCVKQFGSNSGDEARDIVFQFLVRVVMVGSVFGTDSSTTASTVDGARLERIASLIHSILSKVPQSDALLEDVYTKLFSLYTVPREDAHDPEAWRRAHDFLFLMLDRCESSLCDDDAAAPVMSRLVVPLLSFHLAKVTDANGVGSAASPDDDGKISSSEQSDSSMIVIYKIVSTFGLTILEKSRMAASPDPLGACSAVDEVSIISCALGLLKRQQLAPQLEARQSAPMKVLASVITSSPSIEAWYASMPLIDEDSGNFVSENVEILTKVLCWQLETGSRDADRFNWTRSNRNSANVSAEAADMGVDTFALRISLAPGDAVRTRFLQTLLRQTGDASETEKVLSERSIQSIARQIIARIDAFPVGRKAECEDLVSISALVWDCCLAYGMDDDIADLSATVLYILLSRAAHNEDAPQIRRLWDDLVTRMAHLQNADDGTASTTGGLRALLASKLLRTFQRVVDERIPKSGAEKRDAIHMIPFISAVSTELCVIIQCLNGPEGDDGNSSGCEVVDIIFHISKSWQKYVRSSQDDFDEEEHRTTYMIISSVIQTFGEDFYEVLKPSRFFRTKGNTSGCRVDGSDTGRPLENIQPLRDEVRRTAVTALAEVIACDCSQPSWRLGASRPESAMASLIITRQDGGRELGLEIFSRAYDIIQSRQALNDTRMGLISGLGACLNRLASVFGDDICIEIIEKHFSAEFGPACDSRVPDASPSSMSFDPDLLRTILPIFTHRRLLGSGDAPSQLGDAVHAVLQNLVRAAKSENARRGTANQSNVYVTIFSQCFPLDALVAQLSLSCTRTQAADGSRASSHTVEARDKELLLSIVSEEMSRARRSEIRRAHDKRLRQDGEDLVDDGESYTICPKLQLACLLYCWRDVEGSLLNNLVLKVRGLIQDLMVSMEEDIETIVDLMEDSDGDEMSGASLFKVINAAIRLQHEQPDKCYASQQSIETYFDIGVALCALPLFSVAVWHDVRSDLFFDCSRILLSYGSITKLWDDVRRADEDAGVAVRQASKSAARKYNHCCTFRPAKIFSRIGMMSIFGGTKAFDGAITSFIAWSEDVGAPAIHPAEAVFALLDEEDPNLRFAVARAAVEMLTNVDVSSKLVAWKDGVLEAANDLEDDSDDDDTLDEDGEASFTTNTQENTATGDGEAYIACTTVPDESPGQDEGQDPPLDPIRTSCASAGISDALLSLLRGGYESSSASIASSSIGGPSPSARVKGASLILPDYDRDYRPFLASWILLLQRLRSLNAAAHGAHARADAAQQSPLQLWTYEAISLLESERTLFPIVGGLLPVHGHPYLSGCGGLESEAVNIDDASLSEVIRQGFLDGDIFDSNGAEFDDEDAGFDPAPSAARQYSENYIRMIVCCFHVSVSVLSVQAREWFNNLREKSMMKRIESYMAEVVTPSLLRGELENIKRSQDKYEGDLRVRVMSNEVIAEYIIDESSLELVIKLPPIFPLRCVKVECSRSVGISALRLRKLLLSITAFLANRNGTLLEAVDYWKENIAKEFEGMEECPICYSIVHATNHSIPKMKCKTCRKQYHRTCLHKWFSSSHKSNCPMCQTPW